MNKYKVAIVDDNPVHYRTPLYEKLRKSKKISPFVYFFSKKNMSERYVEEGKKKKLINNRTKGFDYKVLKNHSLSGKPHPPKGLFNPGIISELIKNKYDAIIIYGYSSFSKKLSYIGALLSRTPIIFREELNEIRGNSLKRKIKKVLYNVLFKIPDAFLCSYTKNKKFYSKFGVDKRKLFFHPCAVDNELFQELAKKTKKRDARKNLKINEDAHLFLSVGTLEERKRPIDTLKAFEKLNDKNSHLIFVGEGGEKNKLKSYMEKKEIKNVYFYSFKPDPNELAKFYSAADVFVISSDYDPSPKVLNEAMNFSLPVVASDEIGTSPDLVKNKSNGFRFECSNIKELSNKMQKLIKNKEFMERMGKKSLEIVSKWNFDEDVKATIKALNYIKKKK